MAMHLLCVILSLLGVISALERECPASELDKFCSAVQNDDFNTVSTFLGEWGHESIMNTGLCGGLSPLSLAAALGHVRIVDTLLMLDKVVDVNFNEGGSALMLAASEGQNEVVETLLKVEGIDVNLVEVSTGGSALQAAALLGDVDITRQLLLVEGINVNSQSMDGYTPLMMAAKGGHVAVVELLLQHDAVDVGLVDKAGDNVLTTAASIGNHAIISLVQSSSKVIDVNSQNNAGFNALMLSSLLGHTSIVEELLQNKADINANLKGKDEWTALLYAVAKGHVDIVKLLLGIEDLDLDAECSQGWTASNLAAHLEHSAILDLLEAVETAF